MKKIESLSRMASSRPDPRPLDVAGVMNRIGGLRVEDDFPLALPMGFFAGGAAAAAAAAVIVSTLAFSAWTDMASPLAAVESLIDVMDVL